MSREGGREGYDTLLDTHMRRKLDQLGRFFNLVVEHEHAFGFEGLILIEPKPFEPTEHQYDFDVSTVYGFLQKYSLEDEVKIIIEVNHEVDHATLAGCDFAREIAAAFNAGNFRSATRCRAYCDSSCRLTPGQRGENSCPEPREVGIVDEANSSTPGSGSHGSGAHEVVALCDLLGRLASEFERQDQHQREGVRTAASPSVDCADSRAGHDFDGGLQVGGVDAVSER